MANLNFYNSVVGGPASTCLRNIGLIIDFAGVVIVGVASPANHAGVVAVGVSSPADLAGDITVGVSSPADLAGVSPLVWRPRPTLLGCHHRSGTLGRCRGGVLGRPC